MDKRFTIAYITGGSFLGFFISIFTFLQVAPWASKTELEATKRDLVRAESTISQLQQSALTEKDLRPLDSKIENVLSMIREMKDDQNRERRYRSSREGEGR